METILVAVDLKPGTAAVVAQARKHALALGARIVLVNIEPLLPGAEGGEAQEIIKDIEANYDEEIKSVQQIAEALSAEGIENRVFVIEGTTVDQLIGEVAHEAPDLVVVGNHRHGALTEALTYGVRDQLAKNIGCPLLLVPVE